MTCQLNCLFAALLASCLSFTVSGQDVRLNEVIPNNRSILVSGPNPTDWLELVNTSGSTVNLADASLTDNPSSPRKWVFPNGSAIGANGYLLILLDSSQPASLTTSGTLNAGFGLKASGDQILFYASRAAGAGLIDSVKFGFQPADLSLSRSPNGTGSWTIGTPSPGAPNQAKTLSSPAVLKINEWMANPSSGDDWFEIYNPSANPVDLTSLFLTDTLTVKTLSPIPALSFLGSGLDAYIRIWADQATNSGADHANFKLSASGEAIGLFTGAGVQIDAVTFGAQGFGISQGRLPDGAAGIQDFATTPTPGEPNFAELTSLVINEVLSHTDPPLEDAVEIYNTTASPINIGNWYLSNNKGEPKKYQILPNTVVPALGYKVIYESAFNGPSAANPFTFNSAHGDEVYLFMADSAGNLTGFRFGEIFESAENGVSFGRYPTSVPGDHKFVAMARRTLGRDNPNSVEEFRLGTGLSNSYPRVGPLVINEIMFNPKQIGTNDNTIDEYIEIRNLTNAVVALYDPVYPTNRWRLQNAIDFVFPPNTSIAPDSYFLIVSFDPVLNSSALAAFRSQFNVPASVPVFGPWIGKLDNNGEAVELYKPDPVQLPPHPDAGYVPYIRVDKVNYGEGAPWPTGADRTGLSLQRKNSILFGNDPINWQAADPSAGVPNGGAIADTDGDGMTDTWEISYNFDPNNPADGAQDADGDGMTNLAEFIAGTTPRNSRSYLKIDQLLPSTGPTVPVRIRFTAVADKSYTLQYTASFPVEIWQKVKNIPAETTSRVVEVEDSGAIGKFDRYYRLLTPAQN